MFQFVLRPGELTIKPSFVSGRLRCGWGIPLFVQWWKVRTAFMLLLGMGCIAFSELTPINKTGKPFTLLREWKKTGPLCINSNKCI